MGRTLHFSVENSDALTIAEKNILCKVSDSFNSNKYEKIWTCENFYLDPFGYYPNWSNPLFKRGVSGKKDPYNLIDEKWAILKNQGFEDYQIFDTLNETAFINPSWKKGEDLFGFTKVTCNEINAALVYLALITISKKTFARIHLSDEGEFLKVPVIIENGLVKPDQPRAKRDWDYWIKQKMIKKNLYGTRTTMYRHKNLICQFPEFAEPKNFCKQRLTDNQENEQRITFSKLQKEIEGFTKDI